MPNAVQILRTAVPAYQHITPAVPEMQALGVQSPIILGEKMVINDRLRPDRVLVKSISGLRGGDIRDNRQVRSSDHGEVPYDAFWGGKTVTFQGTMEAGNMPMLDKLERDLIASLTTLTEAPIRFNWWDQHDAFFDTQSIAFWTPLSGAVSISGNGRMLDVGGTGFVAYHNLRGGFVDEIVTAKVSVTPIGAANNIGVMAAVTSDTSFLQAAIIYSGAGAWSLNLYAGSTVIATASLPAYTTQTVLWITLQTLSDVVTANVYSVDPRANPTATPAGTATATLMGSMAQQYGYGKAGFVGARALSTTNWAILDWRVDSLWPCDFTIYGRAIQAPSIAHQTQQGYMRFKRDYQFAVRCSDPRIYCPTTIASAVPLATTPSIGVGRTYPRTYTMVYTTPLSEPAGTLLSQTSQAALESTIINRGSWVSKPLIIISGGITNPVITNLSTGMALILDGTIAQNDYIVVDCNFRILKNSAGTSVFSMFDTLGDFLTLVPGDNVIQFSGQQKVGSPTATFYYQSAWN